MILDRRYAGPFGGGAAARLASFALVAASTGDGGRGLQQKKQEGRAKILYSIFPF